MSHNGVYCTNGLKCSQGCSEQLQKCRHDPQYIKNMTNPAETISLLRTQLEAANAKVKELEGVLSTNDERMTDLTYRAWRKIGADVAGLKWSEFIDAIRAERDTAIERSE